MIDPYDTAAVQAVWQRVLGNRQEDRPFREELEEMIAAEQASERSYRDLAVRSGVLRSMLLRIANEEAAHGRWLQLLYRRLYGIKAQTASGRARQRMNLKQELQRAIQEELAAAQAYEKAAASRKQHSKLFNELAKEERRHSQMLQNAANRLDTPRISRNVK